MQHEKTLQSNMGTKKGVVGCWRKVIETFLLQHVIYTATGTLYDIAPKMQHGRKTVVFLTAGQEEGGHIEVVCTRKFVSL